MSSKLKTGGIIYGNTGDSNENWARSSCNSVYFNQLTSWRTRYNTAGPLVQMDSNIAGSAGGWEN